MAIVFLCGATFGSAVTTRYLHWQASPVTRPPLVIERARNVGLERLKTKLGLTASQEQAITKILDDYGKFYQNIEDDREDVAEQGRQQILQALTPDQQRSFNQIFGGSRK